MAHGRMTGAMLDRRGRRGAALVAVVLITLALFALGHGMLVLSLGELAASRAALRYLEARAAAEAAVNGALAAAGAPWMDSVAIGGERALGSRSLGRATGAATLRRLTAESWWVEGVGRVGVAESRSARLAWAMDPFERVTSLRGAVAMRPGAPLDLAGTVDLGGAAVVEPPLTPSDCAPWLSALEAHYTVDPLSAVVALSSGDTLPSLGLLDFTTLMDQVDTWVGGSGVPAPAESLGACEESEPWNWGDPDRPWRPCGAFLPLRGSAGPLDVGGGVGQGVLIVDGDVTFRGSSRYHGLLIVAGELHLEDSARIAGLALAAGGLRVAAGARIEASACWAVRALTAQRATLGRLHVVPGVGSLGPL